MPVSKTQQLQMVDNARYHASQTPGIKYQIKYVSALSDLKFAFTTDELNGIVIAYQENYFILFSNHISF